MGIRRKTRITAIRRPFWAKGLAALFFFFLIIRLAVYLGSDSMAEGLMSRLMENDSVALGILDFELSGVSSFVPTPQGFYALLFATPAPVDSLTLENITTDAYHPTPPAPDAVPNPTDAVTVEHMPNSPNGWLFYVGEVTQEDKSEIYRPGGYDSLTRAAEGILLTNTTSLEIDVKSLLAEPPDIKLTRGEPSVLIIHTHTSEAFTPSDGKTYVPSDPYRTEDQTRNITRVGEEIAAGLEQRGIGVIHDRRSYDFPSFAGSYSRAYTSIRSYLERYPSIKIVLDIHRDSITAPDGSQRKTIAHIDDKISSQIMLVVGTDYAGLRHPLWRENMRLALMLQHEMNVLFPTLARPVFISEFRFNQQATTGSLIIEVGAAGNTLTESLIAARYFAEAAANVILSFYE